MNRFIHALSLVVLSPSFLPPANANAIEHEILVVGALCFENTYAPAMRGEVARALHLERISQLTPHAPR